MSYTNINIPERHSTVEKLYKEIHGLESELKYYKDKYNQTLSVLENIPAAVEEWGQVEISYGKVFMILVKKEG